MKILMIGGVFDNTGGRRSGYFDKLSAAIQGAFMQLKGIADSTPVQIVNGGTYQQLVFHVSDAKAFTHLLWFADVPNDLPKILPGIRERNPNVVLITSKNNRANKYTGDQLIERMNDADSQYLIEFQNGTGLQEGKIVGSIIGRHGQLIIEQSADVHDIAAALVREFDKVMKHE